MRFSRTAHAGRWVSNFPHGVDLFLGLRVCALTNFVSITVYKSGVMDITNCLP